MAKKQFSIEAVFKAIDKFSNPLKGINKKTNQFSRALRTDFAKAQKQVKQFSQSFKQNIGRGLVIGAGLALAAVAKLTKEALKLWDKQAGAIENVNATLKSTGGSVGFSLKQLEKQASSLQKNTFFGDEDILQGVTAQMLTFTSITGTQFSRAQGVVLDMTAKLKGLDAGAGDLKGTTLMLSKALNDPISNLSAMSRSGVQFTQVQKDMIKALAKGGDMAGAQNIILDELERQYGGTAAALAKTAKGMEISFKNLRGDQLERIGKALEPLRLKFLKFRIEALEKLTPYIDKLTTYLSENADMIGNKFNMAVTKTTKTITTLYHIIKPLMPLIIRITAAVLAYKAGMIALAIAVNIAQKAQTIYTTVTKLMAFAQKIGLTTTIQSTAAMVAHKIASFASIVATKAMTVAQWALNVAMDANPIGLIIIAIAALAAFITLIVVKWDTWGKTVLAVMAIFSPAHAVILSIISVVKSLIDNWDSLKASFKNGGFLNGIKTLGAVILNSVLSPLLAVIKLLEKIPAIKKLGLSDKLGGVMAKNQNFIDRDNLGSQIAQSKQSLYAPTQRSESVSRGEVVIKDETGRAEMPNRPTGTGFNLSLQSSGGM